MRKQQIVVNKFKIIGTDFYYAPTLSLLKQFLDFWIVSFDTFSHSIYTVRQLLIPFHMPFV